MACFRVRFIIGQRLSVLEKMYLDNAATTRVCEQAVERALYVMTQACGNPSSLYTMGFEAEREMIMARQVVTDRLPVNLLEIYFTLGGMGANDIALFGAVKHNGRRSRRIVATAVKHPSILRVTEQLKQDGFMMEYLVSDATGHISSEQAEQAVTGDMILASMMPVNNKTSVCMSVETAAEAIRRNKSPVILRADAAQAFCKVPIKPTRVGIDLMTVSSHRIHEPKDADALYVAGQKGFPSRSFGGGQKREVRPDTEPLLVIAGFGAAVRTMPQPQELKTYFEMLRAGLREQFSGFSGVVIRSPEGAMPYIPSSSVPGVRAEITLHLLSSKSIFVSNGSACSRAKPSHVFIAVGFSPELVEFSPRVSFSRFTTTEEIGTLTAAPKWGTEQLVKKSQGTCMREIILVKLGGLVLKGLDRKNFEASLARNIRHCVGRFGNFSIRVAQSTITISPRGEEGLDEAAEEVGKTFGIAVFSRACVAKGKMESILSTCNEYLFGDLDHVKTFKVESKHSGKSFPLKSPEISAEAGAYITENFPCPTVDVHNPDPAVMVEMRDFGACIHGSSTPGTGGISVGIGGRAVLFISGGINNPAAAWCMAKRGVELVPVHFINLPYISGRTEQKVVDLLTKVSNYPGRMILRAVSFAHIQEEIMTKCLEELPTVIMRRFVMRISEWIAVDNGCETLIIGESLGQVANQTMRTITCTEAAVGMSVFWPLIGIDKAEIITISRKIDTFEISIQPFEDCYTVFTPKHPRTKPSLCFVEQAEQQLDANVSTEECVSQVKLVKTGYDRSLA